MNSSSTIDPNRVLQLFRECFDQSATPFDAITSKFALSAAKLEQHRAEIEQMLGLLDENFMDDGGGGWSFLNVCQDRHGELWTGMHLTCEQLLALGQGLGLVNYPLPRDVWEDLPGGMPYVQVARTKFRAAA